jgi:hypothetical protein
LYSYCTMSLVVFVLHHISRCIRLNSSCNSYCTVSLVFLFVCAVQSADDLAILSSIQILWRSGKSCMVVTTCHGTTQWHDENDHDHDVFCSEGFLKYCFTVAFGCNPLGAIGTMTLNRLVSNLKYIRKT